MNNLNRMIAECEYSRCPINVQNRNPRFSWRPETGYGMQKAYRIRVAKTATDLLDNKALVWDSGVVEAENSSCIVYAGEPLHSKTRYWWQAEMTLTDDTVLHTGTEWFETAILSADEWKAKWISVPVHRFGVTDLFRKSFRLESAPVSGRLYISGIGYYEAFLNGCKIGDRVLEPGWTDYRKHVLYSVYDITDMLCAGENTLGIELAEGWYGMRHPSFDLFMGKQPDWNGTPRLILEADIFLENGKQIHLISGKDSGFSVSPGAVRENSVYDGEIYDARLAQPGWNCNGFVETEWEKAVEAKRPGGVLSAQQMPPIRVNRRWAAVSKKTLSNSVVADFGQNFAGWVAVKVKGNPGSKLTIRYGETLKPDGSVNQDNLRGAKARDVYILNGNGEEEWHPRFTYHGFRYAQLEPDGDVQLIDVEAQAVYTDVQETGGFDCSEEILNRCFEMMLRTECSNMHSVPTDCPQRDERMAWLNDVTVRCEEAIYNFDLRLFYEKWLDDIADAQLPAGSIPDTAPYVYCGNPSFHISSCFVLIPWLLYCHYGDKTALEKHYEQMKRYVSFLASQRGEDGVIGAPYFGEWAPPAAECDQQSPWSAEPVNIPPGTISTGYLAYDCVIMKKAAAVMNRSEDIPAFERLFSETTEAINRKYYDAEKGYYVPGSQAVNIFPLLLEFTPDPLRTQKQLLDDLTAHEYHITTGNQMTKYWFELLDKLNLNDVALRMATDTGYPSLGYMAENGATTLWERWENLDGSGMNSHNHPMNGAYTVWYYKTLAGIKRTGNGRVTLRPAINLDIAEVKAELQTPKGKLAVAFQKTTDFTAVYVTVPFNTQADIELPLDCIACLEENQEVLWRRAENTENTKTVFCLSRSAGEYHFILRRDKEKESGRQ